MACVSLRPSGESRARPAKYCERPMRSSGTVLILEMSCKVKHTRTHANDTEVLAMSARSM